MTTELILKRSNREAAVAAMVSMETPMKYSKCSSQEAAVDSLEDQAEVAAVTLTHIATNECAA